VYVTHDQIEAMAMGDRIVVMSKAVVQQVGTPQEVYHNPSNLFVAQFIGSPGMNLIKGTYADGVVLLAGANRFPVPAEWQATLAREAATTGGEIVLGFRPEAAIVSSVGPLEAEVYASDMHGAFTMLHLDLQQDNVVHVRASRQSNYPIGTSVRFTIAPEMLRFFNPKTEAAILRSDLP
jgi:multiple sugar transport system ATP-binding protein